MCFEWMSHREIDLPLRMVAPQCPGVTDAGDRWGMGGHSHRGRQSRMGERQSRMGERQRGLPLDSFGRRGVMP